MNIATGWLAPVLSGTIFQFSWHNIGSGWFEQSFLGEKIWNNNKFSWLNYFRFILDESWCQPEKTLS